MDPLAPFSRRFARWLGYDTGAEPDTLKWVVFAQKLLGVITVSVLGVGLLLTALAAFLTQKALTQSLQEREERSAQAAARIAFVPMALENRQALAGALSGFLADPDIASLEAASERGDFRVLLRSPSPPAGPLGDISVPIRASAPGGSSPGKPIGTLRLAFSRARIQRQIFRLHNWSFALAVLLMAAALAAGFRVVRQMTGRMRLLVGEARLSEDLRRSNRDLEALAYVASHDLQEPLRKISSYLQLLEQRHAARIGAEGREFIAVAVDGARRMQRLIQDLLEYSRIGRSEASFADVPLKRVLEQVLENLQVSLKETGAKVEAGPLPVVSGEEPQLLRLLQNLISNSLKYHGEREPRLRVRAEERGAQWVIAVADNGIGIAPEHFERIFLPFQRLHTRREYPGTGIGLSICQRVVERHKGRIWLESKPGEGTTFFFTLPRSPGAAR